MKRILSVILTLCLLCAMPFVRADVDYAADYETALTLARNDLTNAQNLQEAIDILQRLGGYELAKYYVRYLNSILDIQGEDPNLDLLKGSFETFGMNAAFVQDLVDRRFPSCEDLISYTAARQMENAGSINSAYKAYSAINVLDSADRAYEMYVRIATATPEPTSAESEEAVRDVTAAETQKKITIGMSHEEMDALCREVISEAETWTEETVPKTIAEFPLIPDFLLQLDREAGDAEFYLAEEDSGSIWHTTIGHSFDALGLTDYGYLCQLAGTPGADWMKPLDSDPDSIYLGKNLELDKVSYLGCEWNEYMNDDSYTIVDTSNLVENGRLGKRRTVFMRCLPSRSSFIQWDVDHGWNESRLDYGFRIWISYDGHTSNIIIDYDLNTGELHNFRFSR